MLANGKDYAVSYLILPDGTIQVTTEQEALALRAHLLTATPDIAALQGQLRGLADVVRACQDELGGADPAALAGLIRKLRLMEPSDQLRIERNYWRARSMELGEEVIIWQRRAGRDVLPTTEIFADLLAKVKAASSNYALQLAAAKPAAEPRALAAHGERTAASPPPAAVAPKSSAPAAEPAPVAVPEPAPPPRVELRMIRSFLSMSQRELAAALGQTQARISLMERGTARVSPELLAAARALTASPSDGSPGAEPAAGSDSEDAAGKPLPAPRAADSPVLQNHPLSDADLDELAGIDPDESTSEVTHAEGAAP